MIMGLVLRPTLEHTTRRGLLAQAWADGDVLVYETRPRRDGEGLHLGRCLAALRWDGAQLVAVIGVLDGGTEREILEALRAGR